MLMLAQTVFGLDQALVLLVTTAVATTTIFVAMSLILFFAFAPHLSDRWRDQFMGPTDPSGRSTNE